MSLADYANLVSGECDILSLELSKQEKKSLRSSHLGKILSKRPGFYKEAVSRLYLRLPKLQYSGSSKSELIEGVEGWMFYGSVNSQQSMDGPGLLVHMDGSVFEGHFKNGNIHGEGRSIKSTSVVIIGFWESAHSISEGLILQLKDKKIYSGSILAMMPNGQGKEMTPSFEYEGEFKNGLKTGSGTIIWSNGNQYRGSFSGNKLHGYGVYNWDDGTKYKGGWKFNKMHGKGYYKWLNGMTYNGTYKDGLKDGYGVLTYPSGKVFKGFWEKGREDGLGTEVKPNGETRNGIWQKGELTKYFQGEVSSPIPVPSAILLEAMKRSSNSNSFFANILSLNKVKPENPSDTNVLNSSNLANFGGINIFNLNKNKNQDSQKRLSVDLDTRGNSDSSQKHQIEESKEEKADSFQKQKRLHKRNKSEKIGLAQKPLLCFLSEDSKTKKVSDIDELLNIEEYRITAEEYKKVPLFRFASAFSSLHFNSSFVKIDYECLYKGETDSRGIPEGNGTLAKEGRVYIGEWKDGFLNGLGRYISAKGRWYEGYWQEGKQHGFGVKTSHSARYIGEWINGQRHGFGVQESSDGNYKGYWRHGKQNGQGTLHYSDGSFYVGCFENGVIHGHGTLTLTNGSVFTAKWVKGKLPRHHIRSFSVNLS